MPLAGAGKGARQLPLELRQPRQHQTTMSTRGVIRPSPSDRTDTPFSATGQILRRAVKARDDRDIARIDSGEHIVDPQAVALGPRCLFPDSLVCARRIYLTRISTGSRLRRQRLHTKFRYLKAFIELLS